MLRHGPFLRSSVVRCSTSHGRDVPPSDSRGRNYASSRERAAVCWLQRGSSDELREAFANYPTKADLKSEIREALANYARKADLKSELANYPTKNDLTLANYATRADLDIVVGALCARIKDEVVAGEHRLCADFVTSQQRLRNELGEDFARQTGTILEAVQAMIGVIGEKYKALSARVSPLEGLPARVSRLEEAVFAPTAPKRRRARRS